MREKVSERRRHIIARLNIRPCSIKQRILRLDGDYRKSGLAYALSKKFVIRYAQMCAGVYGAKGIRVVSLSPGLVATDMGNLEAGEGSRMLRFTAERRMGRPEELGYALASLADERNGYLAGVDVLCDGGASFGKLFRGRNGVQKAETAAVPAV